MDYVSLNKILLVVTAILSLWLGSIVLFADRTKKSNIAFFFLVLTTSFWIFVYYLVMTSSNEASALLWAKIGHASVSVFYIPFYLFFVYFLNYEKKLKYLSILVYLVGLSLFYTSIWTNFIVKGVQNTSRGVEILLSPGSLFFYLTALLLSIFVVCILIKSYLHADKIKKRQISFFLAGIFLWVIMNIIFNMAPALLEGKTIVTSSFGNYSFVILLCFTAYAILKQQLFNIKIITTETTVIALSVALLIETTVSPNISEGIIKGIVWLLATYGGYILIKSVKVEIKQKEDLQKLTKKLDEANQHLEELGEAKDNFLSMAAHELNTPIAAIEGYLSMIIDEKMAGNINEKAMGYLKNIYGSSKRLAGLVKNLLNVSRIESNRIHLIFSEMQIEDVIAQSIAEIKIKADEIGHKLTFEKSKTAMPKTWFDAERITEVIINIIGNAIKYTEPPGKIVVSTHTDGDKIVVAVEDNGRGIPKDKEEHIFEKFAQVNVLTDQVKGTGLGMFITKNLIALHKGKVWFKSSTDEKDHGTTFYFCLPILKEKPFDPHEGEGALFQTPRRSSSSAGQAGKQDEPKKTDNADNGREPEAAKAGIEAKSSVSNVLPTETKAEEKNANNVSHNTPAKVE